MKYDELKNKHINEFNQMVIYIDGEITDKHLKMVGVKNTEDLRSFGNAYFPKETEDKIISLMEKHMAEIEENILADKTGEGFIKEMFIKEIEDAVIIDHKKPQEALKDMGYTLDELKKNKALANGFGKACEFLANKFTSNVVFKDATTKAKTTKPKTTKEPKATAKA